MSSSTHISNLPNHILQLIFCELPITTLAQDCRYVCKSWKHILEDPEFVILYQQLTELVLCTSRISKSFYHYLKGTCWLAFRGKSCSSYPATMLNKLYGDYTLDKYVLSSSCNGLLCLYEDPYWKKPTNNDLLSIRIANPITGECWRLPSPPLIQPVRKRRCALGFSPKTNQYKVFVHDRLQSNHIAVKVYVLAIGTWKDIVVPGDYYAIKGGWHSSYDAFVRGSFHWLFRNKHEIHAFDFEIEQFKSFPLPASFHDCYHYRIGVLSDSLSMCLFNDVDSLGFTEVWVMEEYGVLESWTRKLVVDSDWQGEFLSVRRFLQNGDILQSSFKSFFTYNPNSRSFEKLDICGIESVITAFGHTPIFTSLKDVLKGFKSKSERL